MISLVLLAMFSVQQPHHVPCFNMNGDDVFVGDYVCLPDQDGIMLHYWQDSECRLWPVRGQIHPSIEIKGCKKKKETNE